MTEPDLATYHCIIPHPSKPKFMVVKHSDGEWYAPRTQFFKDYRAALRGAELTEAIFKNYGLDTFLVRHVYGSEDDHFVELEVRPKGMTRKLEAAWVGKEEMQRLRGDREGPPNVYETWLEQAESGAIPPHRRPWERRGWLQPASRWIHRELERLGIQVVGSVRQVTAAWRESSVLRVKTTQGWVYFKASAPDAVNEARLTAVLSAVFPQRVAQPLAVHEKLPWMLNRDLGKPLGTDIDQRDQQQLLFALGDLQVKACSQMKRWLALDVPVESLDQLVEFLQGFESRHAQLRAFVDIDEDQFRTLAMRLGKLVVLCRDLAQGPVPDSLVHDDFTPANCFRRDGGYWLADWGRSWIGHPFMSLHGWRARLRDPDPSWSAYFDPFTRFAGQAELEELMKIAQQLLPARSLYRQFELLEKLPEGEMAAVKLQRGVHKWVNHILSK